ncbi:MAG: hypothetical protein QOE33_3367 [Acidobacteriota bacterium]|nr:hypothetical protein [Acidobacteriota bacterium]
MFKQKTSLAFGLTLTLLLGQLPHANRTFAATILPAKRKSSCLNCFATRDAQPCFPNNLATLSTGTVALLTFRRAGQGQRFNLREKESGAQQSFDLTEQFFNLTDDNILTEQVAGLTRTDKQIGATDCLTQIAGTGGNAINLTFNARGNVASITNNPAIIALEWSNAEDSHLLAVSDSTGLCVTFRQVRPRGPPRRRPPR